LRESVLDKPVAAVVKIPLQDGIVLCVYQTRLGLAKLLAGENEELLSMVTARRFRLVHRLQSNSQGYVAKQAVVAFSEL
jgi:hypothetical protein